VTEQADTQQRLDRARKRLVGRFAIPRDGDSPLIKEGGQSAYNR